jgi:hypothetical protein
VIGFALKRFTAWHEKNQLILGSALFSNTAHKFPLAKDRLCTGIWRHVVRKRGTTALRQMSDPDDQSSVLLPCPFVPALPFPSS